MIDHSNSTMGYVDKYYTYHVGTDPEKAFRIGTISKFLDKYGAKSNLSYGFFLFGDNVLQYDSSSKRFVAQGPTLFVFRSSLGRQDSLGFVPIHARYKWH